MRNEQEINELILTLAKDDERIRAVLLNGSRVNTKIKPDRYQDFDVVFIVNDLKSFREHPAWVDVFGDRIIMQMPNEMQLDDQPVVQIDKGMTYLMLFQDTNRIDLQLLRVEDKDMHQDSLTEVLLDKDQLYTAIAEPSDQDYWVKQPTQQQFSDCCNEFWWVSTYVMKGLLRKQVLYAKDMLEDPVRKMFMRMLSWHVGIQAGFTVNLGMCYKYLEQHVYAGLWQRILMTYPDANEQNIRSSFREMVALFQEKEVEVATQLGLTSNEEESKNVITYLKDQGLWDE